MVNEIKQDPSTIPTHEERDKVVVDGIEEPVFSVGETNGLGINNDGIIQYEEETVIDKALDAVTEVVTPVEPTHVTPIEPTHVKDSNLHEKVSVEEALKHNEPVVKEVREIVREEEVDVFIPQDPLEEMKEKLPEIKPVEEEKPAKKDVEESPREAELRRKTETLEKIRQLVASEGDVDVWKGTGLNTGAEIKPVSNPIELEENRPILTDSTPLTMENLEETIGSISLPPDSPEAVLNYFSANPEIFTNTDDASGDISTNVNTMINSLTDAGELISVDYDRVKDAINEKETVLKQTLTIPNNNGKAKSRLSYIPKENGLLTGIHAKAAVMDALGLRSHFTVVLPHSGLVAVISAPTSADLIDLQFVLDTSKIVQGRRFGGSIYGSTTWFISNEIVDLFIRKIARINLKDATSENIRRHLSPMDIPAIAWGLGCAMFPDGFNYNRTALLDNGKPKLVVGKLWLSDMEVFADNRFSTRQKQHLIAAHSTPSSNEEIESYKRDWKKEEDVEPFERTIMVRKEEKRKGTITKETILVLGDSNMNEFVEHGAAWDNYLTESINQTLAMVSDERIRSNYLSSKIAATELREFSHYIKKVKIKETYSYSNDVVVSEIDSREVILSLLDDIATLADVKEATIKVVNEFINSRLKAVYGVPTISDFEEKYNTSSVSNHIVPVNTVMTFFTLTAQIYRSLGIQQDS